MKCRHSRRQEPTRILPKRGVSTGWTHRGLDRKLPDPFQNRCKELTRLCHIRQSEGHAVRMPFNLPFPRYMPPRFATLIAEGGAISAVSGTPFLGRFAMPEPISVVYFSGEGGPSVAQEYGRRIAESKGLEP
jgi:hypothetical protein